MKKEIRKIAVLTSGGDCAGLNAVIRAVVHRAVEGFGWEVLGVRNGTKGLMDRPVDCETLTLKLFTGNILRLGGTILGTTNKGDPFNYPMSDGSHKDRSDEIIDGLKDLGVDALIGIGGDGSMKILNRLAEKGEFQFIGVPKTIDNDVAFTEFSVGFTTAVNSAVDALDRLQPTAASHSRVMILEVMGRDAGHIAIHAGIAGGADVILIPEIPVNLDKVAEKIKAVMASGRHHSLVVCSEAIKDEAGKTMLQNMVDGQVLYGGVGHIIGEKIHEMTGAETRVTVLGHVQRGGQPAMRDRLIASAFGVHAVDLIAQGKSNRMVAWQHRGVVDVPLEEVVVRYSNVDLGGTIVATARGLGICLGD
ncbi:MAG: ATP-dependent 6-phosphofructokinase [Alphaproteobacteria bacterium]|nr:ATP-dependent 6-phosphofructokinase [Rhodospirillales bacterium]MCW9045789.1 ATP-dependent 6-phosphofructokinase [Alphaproteobacteria bacterium]